MFLFMKYISGPGIAAGARFKLYTMEIKEIIEVNR